MPLRLIQRKGGTIWWIRGTVCGTAIYRSTKLSDRRLAEKVRARTLRDLEELHAAGAAAPKRFSDACTAYLNAGGSSRFLPPLTRSLGKKLLRDLSQADIDAFARRLYPNALPSTLNRQVYTPFIAVWNFAAENDWARTRKWRRPRRPRSTTVSRAIPRVGTAPVDYDTAAGFVAAMSPDPAMLMTFLFFTGLRPIEAFALQCEDVSIDKQWLTVRSSKTGQPRGVPLHSFLCEWLPSLVGRGGALFRTPRGEPYRIIQDGGGGLKTAIKGARRRSGINEVSPYTARHTVSTQLVIEGVHPHMKDQILGHAADDMSRRYTNVPQAPLIEAIGRLPVPAAWRALPWVASPTDWFGKLAEGTGKRTDLERKNLPK